MSEYQYYEFQAIDRPLDDKVRAALRAITSRAQITRTSLVNVYHYGDFKGNPARLMEKYFDAHLYFANWGTRHLMLRLPLSVFRGADAKPYCVNEGLNANVTKEHIIFDFYSDSEGDGDDWEYEGGYYGDDDEGDGDERLSSLIPIRNELAAGDLRALYIGWLAGIMFEEDDNAEEPPVPPGLGKLTGAQRALADFLRVDDALLTTAATASADAIAAGPTEKELKGWVKRLPEAEKDAFLVRLLKGDSAASLGSELLSAFRAAQPKKPNSAATTKRRTVGELFASQERLAEENARREAKRKADEAARRERERAAARARHLDSLVGREEQLWRDIEAAVAKKLPKEYDHAMQLIQDLRELAERTNSTADVFARVRVLRERHASKRSFLQRLDKAGFPR